MPFTRRTGVGLFNFYRCPIGMRDQKGKVGVTFLYRYKSSKFNETRYKDQFSFLSRKIIDKSKIYFVLQKDDSCLLEGICSV